MEFSIHDFLNQEIVPYQSLGFSAEQSPEGFRIHAPLDQNHNDKQTGFAGSIYSAAVLTGWSLLFLQFQKEDQTLETLIHEASIVYHRPVTGDFSAFCASLPESLYSRYLKDLNLQGKAVIPLSVEIQQEGLVKAVFSGRYVVKRKKGVQDGKEK